MTKRSLFFKINSTDLVVIVFYSLLNILNLLFMQSIPTWYLHIAANCLVILFVFSVTYLDCIKNYKTASIIHSWYLILLVPLTFKELYYMNYAIHGRDYDQILINIDRFIFGTDPTHFLYNYSSPLLTEILQIAYSTFYFLPVILGINLLLNKKNESFHYMIFAVVYGFFLSYIGYLLLPAIGPRFTLHEFLDTDKELPGLFLTTFIRDILNRGESITSNMVDAAKYVQRDVFPSGHTQMTVITMYLALKTKSNTKYFIWITGLLLIFATVYMRYHYVIDVFAGVLFFVLTMWSGKILYNYWNRKTNKPLFDYQDING